MKKRLHDFFHRVLENISRPEMRVLPGQLAFFFVLSLIPLIALIGSIASQMNLPIDTIRLTLESMAPSQVVQLIMPVLSAKDVTLNMILFYGGAFLLASNGTYSMIIASNSIYKVEDGNYISGRLKAFFMTLVLVLLLLFVLLVPAFGDSIISFITGLMKNNSKMISMVEGVYQLLKYPLSAVLIYYPIKLLYTMAPDKVVRSRETSYGAMVTTIGWIVATEVYSIYTTQFVRYDLFYGSISNILILMLWVYILAYIFVLGMALNASRKEE